MAFAASQAAGGFTEARSNFSARPSTYAAYGLQLPPPLAVQVQSSAAANQLAPVPASYGSGGRHRGVGLTSNPNPSGVIRPPSTNNSSAESGDVDSANVARRASADGAAEPRHRAVMAGHPDPGAEAVTNPLEEAVGLTQPPPPLTFQAQPSTAANQLAPVIVMAGHPGAEAVMNPLEEVADWPEEVGLVFAEVAASSQGHDHELGKAMVGLSADLEEVADWPEKGPVDGEVDASSSSQGHVHEELGEVMVEEEVAGWPEAGPVDGEVAASSQGHGHEEVGEAMVGLSAHLEKAAGWPEEVGPVDGEVEGHDHEELGGAIVDGEVAASSQGRGHEELGEVMVGLKEVTDLPEEEGTVDGEVTASNQGRGHEELGRAMVGLSAQEGGLESGPLLSQEVPAVAAGEGDAALVPRATTGSE